MSLQNFGKFSLILCIISVLAACGDNDKMMNVIRDNLKDPDSAKFYDYEIMGHRACYVINAKNSMGGYTGKKTAMLLKSDKEWQVVMINEFSLNECLEIIKK